MNNIVFVAGVRIADLEKLPDLSMNYLSIEHELITSLRINKVQIECEMYADLRYSNGFFYFNDVQWSKQAIENYSSIGEHIIYISREKKTALDKVHELYTASTLKRKKLLEKALF